MVCLLFKKNSKGIKKQEIQNRFINDGYTINLTFEVDNDQYEIDVKRKATIKCKLWKNGEDISSHTATNTYKTVQELLGLDFKTFSARFATTPGVKEWGILLIQS